MYIINNINIYNDRMKEAIINLINKWACCHDWQLEKEIEVECDNRTIYHKYIYMYVRNVVNLKPSTLAKFKPFGVLEACLCACVYGITKNQKTVIRTC